MSDRVVDSIDRKMKNAKISRYKLAQDSGVTQSSLSYLFDKKRRPTIAYLFRLTNALNIHLADIIAQVEKDTQK